MASRNSEWMNRAARRKDLELSMFKTQTRRASERDIACNSTPPAAPCRKDNNTESISCSPHSATSDNIPSSPSDSIQSTAASSLSASTECGDQAQALLQKVRNNKAAIAANEAQMRALDAMDGQVSTGIQTRLAAVQALNDRLNYLSKMLSRIEDVSRGNF